MGNMIDILIPTYGRAGRIPRIVKNIEDASQVEYSLWFCVEPDDVDTIEVIQNTPGCDLIINRHAKNYSGAINTGYFSTSAPFLFAGADDIEFHLNWDRDALKVFDDPWIGVVGTNDGVNPYVAQGFHATHYFVRRSYLDVYGGIVDLGPGSFLFDGYGHNYTDTEFIGTAKMRAKFHPCFTSRVIHKHWSTGAMAPDATTDKANATYAQDSALYDSRRELWFNISR